MGNVGRNQTNPVIFTEEQEQEIIRLRTEERKSAKAIGEIMGCSGPSIEKVFLKFNLPTRALFQDIPPEMESKICQLKLEDRSIPEISKLTGINDKAITNVLQKNNISTKFVKGNFKKLTPEKIKQIIEDYKSIGNLIEVARKYHIWVPNLKKILKENGQIINQCKHTKETEEKIRDLFQNSTLTLREISQQMGGVTHKVIKRCCKGLERKFKSVPKKREQRPLFEVWIEKYGEEDGNRKIKEYQENASKRSSGENNPMYGKPAPEGSGNGWKGYYKGVFFRSLREMSFLHYLESNEIVWHNGESLFIEYYFMGEKGTYRPDFLVGNAMYEIKPERMIRTPKVSAKSQGAEIWCEKNGLIYVITDYPILPKDLTWELVRKGIISFEPQYMERFLHLIFEKQMGKYDKNRQKDKDLEFLDEWCSIERDARLFYEYGVKRKKSKFQYPTFPETILAKDS